MRDSFKNDFRSFPLDRRIQSERDRARKQKIEQRGSPIWRRCVNLENSTFHKSKFVNCLAHAAKGLAPGERSHLGIASEPSYFGFWQVGTLKQELREQAHRIVQPPDSIRVRFPKLLISRIEFIYFVSDDSCRSPWGEPTYRAFGAGTNRKILPRVEQDNSHSAPQQKAVYIANSGNGTMQSN